jgi:glycosyltransferase involved in cell wall biosynthesis
MDIAIVAPSSAPFVIGGAENLWWGLQTYINQCTPHQAELIKLPCPDTDFWQIIDGYRRFSQLKLGHFDLVISTKHPAWMVSHPNHVCYMQHRLRGLYDSYHWARKSEVYDTDHPAVLALRRFMRSHRGGDRDVLEEMFERVQGLRDLDVPPDLFEFPGPFLREIVHFLDGIGLSSTAIRRFAAISRTVARRVNYFPPGAAVEVIHHPSNLGNFRRGPGEYLFTVSRLHESKRVGLLVEAMRRVRSPVRFKIAGTGPQESKLRALSSGDQRIEFLGAVNDDQVIELYARALAVPFVPHDEDYGLITIEAMCSAKPVLTTIDAGGPNEFVRDGETGFSVRPDPAALAERLDYLVGNPSDAQSLGMNGERAVKQITWENTFNRLIGRQTGPRVTVAGPERSLATGPCQKRVTVAVGFPIFPPVSGGQARVFHLYRHLAQVLDAEIELVTFAADDNIPLDEEVAPRMREIRIPRSPEHRHAEVELNRSVDWIGVTDVVMPQLYHLSPNYLQALAKSAAEADCVIASHPYLFPAIQRVSEKPVWYDAHNVEAHLKDGILPRTAAGRRILDAVRAVEADCCRHSALIFACSDRDLRSLAELYGVEMNRLVVVPNGVDLETTRFVPPSQRRANKRQLGIDEELLVLFMGSWHGPNLEAVRYIFDLARRLLNVHFIVLGSAGQAFRSEETPSNVGLMGVVDDATKEAVLAIADLAINPMTAGSGTNLKMLEYMAAGIPVISTHHGARGLDLNGEHLVVTEIENFNSAIVEARSDYSRLQTRVLAARDYVCREFDWREIARRFAGEIAARGASPWVGVPANLETPAPIDASTVNGDESLPDGWFSVENVNTYRRLMERVPYGGATAELGVWRGRSICAVADIIRKKSLRVLAVDYFQEGSGIEEEFRSNISRFSIHPQVCISRMMTTEAAAQIPDASLDLVFIDANHAYDAVKADLLAWMDKVKPGGILAGHDYQADHEGVIRAVNETFGTNLTVESSIWYAKKA